MTTFFEKAGNYTKEVIQIVKKRLAKGGIAHIIIATSKGETAQLVTKDLHTFFDKASPKIPIVAITHQAGFNEPGKIEIDLTIRKKLEKEGVKVITTTHALAGIGRAIRKKHGTWQISELIAETLRIFGQGTKVCAEITLMAADAGAIGIEPIIAIGGTGRGADTAWVIQPAHTHSFFNMKMQELLCKPRNF
jgi:uncharacterized protein